MRIGTRLAAAALAGVLALGLSAQAADAPGDTAAARQEDLDFLYSALQEQHPDLFSVTPEAEFLAKKAEIASRLAEESEAQYVLDLQSLTALAGDSHTTLGLHFSEIHYYPFALAWYEEGWVLSRSDREEEVGLRVTAAAGLPMEAFCQRFAPLVSADNEVKLARQVRSVCYVAEILDYLGLTAPDGSVSLTLEQADGRQSERTYFPFDADGGQPDLFRLSQRQAGTPVTAYDRDRAYFAQPLDGETYYIQYNLCREDPDLPMETFTAQVAADLDAGGYTQVLLDLRNNGGGSDGVLVPLLYLLRERMDQDGLRLFGLIGETTFSSALINAVEIREMGGILAGTATSGSVDHFGAVRQTSLPHSGMKLGISSRFIALDSLMEAALPYEIESLRPDVEIPQSLADELAGRDTLVEYLTAQGGACALPEEPASLLTRGRLAWMLWQAAGSPAAEQPASFQDLLPFAYYAAAVDWAAQAGIITGVSADAFQASRPVSRQEAAVMADRFAAWMGLPAVDGAPVPSGAAPWAAEAAAQACARGLLDAGDGGFRPDEPLTRAQGRTLTELLVRASEMQ